MKRRKPPGYERDAMERMQDEIASRRRHHFEWVVIATYEDDSNDPLLRGPWSECVPGPCQVCGQPGAVDEVCPGRPSG
jgi:hypothetical protein